MSYLINRRTLLGGGAAAVAAAAGLGPRRAMAAEPMKVAFVYVGPVGDFGFSYQHDLARKQLQAKLGDKIVTNYVEKVAEGPDSERVFRQLASTGHQMIYGCSFGYMNPMVRVARQFPKVYFEHATGYKTARNLAVYNARFYEGRTICGTLAGHLSKSGITGYIGTVPIPEVVMGINAYTLAAQKVNPKTKVKVIWTNSWFDPGKEADAAKSLIDQGADMLCTHADSPAVMQTAEERHVHSFGQSSDMHSFGPNAQLTAIVDTWAPYYIQRTQEALNGTWKTGNIWWGLKEGMITMAPYGPGVTAEARAAADKVKAGIIDGSVLPFGGPIVDQKGAQRLAAGAGSLPDSELQKMDWYVQGVQA